MNAGVTVHAYPFVMPLAAVPMRGRGAESPAFELERRLGGVEVRRYPPTAVAEVWVEGPAAQAGNQAFPILAGYLFGQNLARQRIAMTSPVLRAVASGRIDGADRMPGMPVRAGCIVQFLLSQGTTRASAPQPTDPRVTVRELPERRVAAILYQGAPTVANDAAHLQLLTTALRESGLRWSGEPVWARHNRPHTLWILQRHELWLTLP